VLAALGGIAVLALLGGGLVAWHYSSVLLEPNHEWHSSVDVEAVAGDRIVLGRSEESERPGVYGLVWRGGHAIVGPILRRGEDTVTRRLSAVDGYLVPGIDADLDTDVYNGDPRATLGVPFTAVAVPGELGRMPAWVVPPAGRPSGSWAIVVHGMNGTRREGLRITPALREAGLTTMLISYRNDLGAPESPDGLHHLGMTEWRDLEAAARYALRHGARRLVLIGYSLGGAIITQLMERSDLAPRVSALVLDAPVLDWRGVLEFNATQTGFPAVAANPLEWAIGARIDADWDSLDALGHMEDFRLPILLFHSTDDDVVPVETSDEFAEDNLNWVIYYRVPDAGHTQSWNVEPRLYERRLTAFLDRALEIEKAPETDRARPRGPGSTTE
jgi:alpha-beta hydrolase superfamily lysophospholipase